MPNNQVFGQAVGGVPARRIMSIYEYRDKCINDYPSATENELNANRKETILRIVNEHEAKT